MQFTCSADYLWKAIIPDRRKASEIRLSPANQAPASSFEKTTGKKIPREQLVFLVCGGCVVSTWKINDSDAHRLPVYTSSVFWLLSRDPFSDTE